MKLDELNQAIFSNDLEKIAQLLKAGIDPNQQDANGVCPLFHTINFGSVEAVNLLLDYGADINHTNWQSKTPWLAAVETNNLAKIALLRSRGVDTTAQNNHGQTSLHYAAMRGQESLFRDILEHSDGEEVLRSDRRGNSILHLAAAWHNPALVEICLTQTPVPIDAKNHSGETAFQRAIQERQIPIAERLLNVKCNVNLADNNKEYPILTLTRAFKNDHQKDKVGGLELLKTLITAGSPLNEANCDGETPLLVSVRANHLPFIQLLLTHSADINYRDKTGATPLLVAVMAENLTLVKFFLDSHADAEIRDNKQISPLIAATKQQSIRLIELLLSHNIQIDLDDKELKEAINSAKNPEILQLLKNKTLS